MRPRAPESIVYVGTREPIALGAILNARAELSPDAVFLRFGAEQRTFAQTVQCAQLAADALASLGVGRGDKVALMLPNSLEFIDLWFASAMLGAILVPVNTALKGDGLRYIVEHSQSRVAVVDEPLQEVYEAALGTAGPRLRFGRGAARGGWPAIAELLAGAHPRAAQASVRPGDLASVLYTSGTTGLPKGVMNCHAAYHAAGREFAERYVRVRAEDVLYTTLPLFHVNAQMLSTVGALVSGVPLILSPRFSASRFFDEIREHGATVFNYIGAMLTMLHNQIPRDDDGENPVRLTVGGAAPAELWERFEARFGLQILEIYGLTETATFCLGSPPDDVRVGKLGLPVSWAEVQVQREDGTVADAGEPGEIVVRSKRPQILFEGYYRNEQATRAAMERGWFHSGDRGRRDADGYFVFLDRLKDTIRRRGENISSYEVERIVNTHPDVVESAAVGVSSELGEEDVMIVVVVHERRTLDPHALVGFCEERMAAFMVPRYVRIREQLPKTATQRVQKFTLREEGTAGAWDRTAETAR
jgi:crotonobetaine/carnitine-CoA ligase